MYYKNTINKIRESLSKKYKDAKPLEDMNNNPSYILWMLLQLEEMKDSHRAARWIGWILRVVEEDLKLWDNYTSRKLIRLDKNEGLEK